MTGYNSLDLPLAHLFRRAGRAFLFDGAGGGLARVGDDESACWEVFLSRSSRVQARACGGGGDRAGGAAPLPPGFERLAAAGFFRRPPFPAGPLPAPGLHSLCLNVAHACNLACTYCFAGGGAYSGGTRGLMTAGMAAAAVDFLLANARPGRALSVDFFGGEPLLAWDVVERTVAYATAQGEAQGNPMRFSLTTNATLVDDDRARFIAERMSSVIVSLDGRPEVHDRMRPGLCGEGSYDASMAGARAISAALAAAPRPPGLDMPAETGRLWVRGTYTRHNRDFWRDVEHLAAEGFSQISLEPVLAPPDAPYALSEADLPALDESYGRVLGLAAGGGGVRFFHFELNTGRSACIEKRFGGCGAGLGYVCVSPSGQVYPCHQFDGESEFELLSLSSGGSAGGGPVFDAQERFATAHIGSKDACRSCWAQLHCGGGCHYTAWRYGGNLHTPYGLGCELLKLRLEHALALSALRAGAAGPGPGPERARPG